ncbi:hypothetical protein pb186bvf_017228 [Paramecium bursaria]
MSIFEKNYINSYIGVNIILHIENLSQYESYFPNLSFFLQNNKNQINKTYETCSNI